MLFGRRTLYYLSLNRKYREPAGNARVIQGGGNAMLKPGRRSAARLFACTLASCGACFVAAAEREPDVRSLAQLSLEELMQVEVGIVAGRPQQRASTPAALTVITAEDIRRSGHRTIAEALRLVPGMYVARVNSSSWLAGARGLTGSALTSTRYLVMVDGRIVHDPLISGTFWDVVDVMVEDIDRIEVIRGPGPTLWGVNAMNGVVHVVTKHSRDTQGALLQAGAGDPLRTHAAARFGGTLDGGSTYRVWAKHNRFDGFEGPAGDELHDEWSTLRTGFRVDGALDRQTGYTFQGDLYSHPVAMASVRLPVPGRHQQFEQRTAENGIGGANLLFRVTRDAEPDRGWALQAYYDRTRRETSRFGVERDTIDVDYRRWLDWGSGQQLIWGGQFNWTDDRIANGPVLQLDPWELSWVSSNVFVQNTSELVPGRVFATLGSKLTHHDFVGWQVQPSARAWWTPDDRQTLWAAVSRPVRVPSRLEMHGQLVFSYVDTGLAAGGPASGTIVPVALTGDTSLQTETMRAWELGHRIRFGERWALDTAVFHNDYTRLIGVPPGIFGAFDDTGTARTSGIEATVSAKPRDGWRLEGSWSHLRTSVSGPILPFEEDSNPRNMAQLRSYLDIGEDVEFNAAAYYVDRVPFNDIDAYTRLDLGLTWRPRPGLELAAWAQNLLDSGHQESSGAQVPRSIYLQGTVRLGR